MPSAGVLETDPTALLLAHPSLSGMMSGFALWDFLGSAESSAREVRSREAISICRRDHRGTLSVHSD